MKQLLLIFIILLTALTHAFSQVRSKKSTSSRQAIRHQAVVDAGEATFTFPLSPGLRYEWCPGGLQYAWTVEVPSDNQKFELGYFMFTAMGASPCGEGNIQKLLQDGQFSLFRQDGDSGSTITGITEEGFATYGENYSDEFLLEKTVVTGNAVQGKLTIKLTGAKTIQKLFAEKPKQLIFTSQILENKKTFNIPVTYTAKFLAAGTGTSAVSAKPKISTCPTSAEAQTLLERWILKEPISYTLEELNWKPLERVMEIKDDNPVTYLFYQKGYLRMEEGGYLFQLFTPKGERFKAQYPDGFPIATMALVSVDKISCVKNKLRVDASHRISPSEKALEILGSGIYSIKPFSRTWKAGVEFIMKGGKWELRENFYPSPIIN